jgi:hypothetical protein
MASVDLCKEALEYFKKVKARHIRTVLKIIIPLSAIILIALMAYIIELFPAYDFVLFLVIALSAIFLLVLLFTIILYRTNKPLYAIMLKEYLKSYNYDNGTLYQSTSNPTKLEKAFIDSYLFPKRALMRNYALIENNNGIQLFDCLLLIRNGQYTQKIFDGLYIKVPKKSLEHYQLRSKGKPSTKAIEYKKQDTLGAYTVYIEKDHEITEPINTLYQKVTKLNKSVPFKSIELSQTDTTLHIAIEFKHYNRLFKTIECPEVDRLEKLYFELLNFIDTL